MTGSRISTDFDLTRDSKQDGFLNMPNPIKGSDWSTLLTPSGGSVTPEPG